MKILLLTQVLPYPPDSGPKVKTYHVLRYLAAHGYPVTLASFVRKQEEPYLENLRPYCAEIHAVPMRRSRAADVLAYAEGLRSGLPFLVTRDAKREMFDQVHRLCDQQRFDIVHADQLTMAQYALGIRNCELRMRNGIRNSPAIVFDAHNAVWTIVERARQTAPFFLKPILALEAARIKRYEAKLVDQFDRTLAVSQVDRELLVERSDQWPRGNGLKDKISVIPIAVDCQALRPAQLPSGSSDILTMGTLYYPPNADGVRWFMHQVYPFVKRQVPECSLTIIGPCPPQDIKQFAIRNSQLGITVTGYVPDLSPYLQQAAVMVVPVRAASGMRVRILEGLARGNAVVTTTTGLEGIDAVSGEHLLVVDEPEAFANAVVCLLRDPARRAQLARNGRRLVEEKYDWQVALPRLEQVYQSLVEGKSQRIEAKECD